MKTCLMELIKTLSNKVNKIILLNYNRKQINLIKDIIRMDKIYYL